MRKLILVALVVAAAIAIADDKGLVEYPKSYRSWQHVKTMLIQPGHPLENPFGGIHHVYANPRAMQGLTDGQYEPGAVLVFDLLGYTEENQVIAESARKRLDVMRFDPSRFAATGGWGYATFVGDSQTNRLEQDVVANCFGCHESAAQANFVFSKLRP